MGLQLQSELGLGSPSWVRVRVRIRPRLRLEGGKVGLAITTLDKKACEGLVRL